MYQDVKNDILTKFYAFSLLLYILALYDINWFYSFSFFGVRVFIIVVCLIKMFAKPMPIRREMLSPLLLLLVFCLYGIFRALGYNNIVILTYVSLLFSMTSVILSSKEEKAYLLRFFTNVIVAIMLLSLVGWIPYLMGIDLPHTDLIQHRNGFHEYYDYYLFRLDYDSTVKIFPRFQGVFLEPGQMATPCVFLLFLNAIEHKVFTFKNFILFVSIILSFSLIAYGLLVFTMVAVAWFNGARFRLPLTIGVLVIITGLSLFFVTREDSALTMLILNRLEYDDELIIAGNNRTTDSFDRMYESFIHSNDRFLGIRNRIIAEEDWSSRASGIKKVIVRDGFVGLAINGLLLLSLFWRNKTKKTLAFLIILVTAYLVRDLLFNPMWFTMAILGFYTLGEERRDKILADLDEKELEVQQYSFN